MQLHFKLPTLSFHLFGYVFSPRLLPSVGTILFFSLFVMLGFWQIDRAHQKQILQDSYAHRSELPAISLEKVLREPPLEKWRYHRIQLEGYYDNQHLILVDNKTFQHHVGYHVLSPLLLSNQNVVLVNRGWVPMGSRNHLPKIAPIQGKQVVLGVIEIPNLKPFLLSHKPENDHWPQRVEAIELKELAKNFDKTLYPFIVLLSPNKTDGFIRDWHPVMTIPVSRHYGYAVQWFSLALTLLIIFIVVNTRRN